MPHQSSRAPRPGPCLRQRRRQSHGAVRGQPDVDGVKARHLAHRRGTRNGDELHRHRHLLPGEPATRTGHLRADALEPRRPALRPGGRRRRQRVRQVLQVQRLRLLHHGDRTPDLHLRTLHHQGREADALPLGQDRDPQRRPDAAGDRLRQFGQRAGVSDALHRQRGQRFRAGRDSDRQVSRRDCGRLHLYVPGSGTAPGAGRDPHPVEALAAATGTGQGAARTDRRVAGTASARSAPPPTARCSRSRPWRPTWSNWSGNCAPACRSM